ncbi:hypothetical protein [Nocardia brasiliensis]|uniref:hypothetical protein n=1 Tax=Nocardia brasiliensis TaxID=37326 RepID=UPI0033F7C455
MAYDPDEDLELTAGGYLLPGADVEGILAEAWERDLLAVWRTYHYYGDGPALPDSDGSDVADGVASADEYRRRRILREAECTPVSVLQALRANVRLVDLLLHFRASVMQEARQDGKSWTEIGAALGMTGEAAADWCQQQVANAKPLIW